MNKSILHYGIGAIGSAAILLFTVPILTRILEPNDYGLGTMFITVMNLAFYICSCGMDQVFVRHYYEQESEENRSVLLCQCLFVVLIFAALVLTVLFPFHKEITKVFFSAQSLALYVATVIGVLSFVINRFVLLSVLMAKSSAFYAFLQISNSLFYFMLVLLLYLGFNYNSFWLIIVAQIIAQILVSAIGVHKAWNLPSIQNTPILLRLESEKLKSYLKYGYPFVFSFAMVWVMQSIDRVIVLNLSNSYELGIYAAAFALIAPLSIIQGVFSNFWVAKVNEIIATGLGEEEKTLFNQVFNFMACIMLVIIITSYMLKDLIVMFLGYNYAAAINIFSILLFIPFFYVLSEIVQVGFLYVKKTKFIILSSFLAMLVNIIGSLVFVPMYGAKGAAISIAFGYFIFFISKWILANKYFKFKCIDIRFTIFILFPPLLYVLQDFIDWSPAVCLLLIFCLLLAYIGTFKYFWRRKDYV